MATKTCFDCGKVLSWTGSGPGWMNSEQWDASKAGDYFAACDKANHENGNCYFWETDTVPVLKRTEPKP
jgi:hypothetical protein